MYLKVYLTELKNGFRTKTNLIWNIIFPIVLGTLFFVAFSSIYESQKAQTVKVAIDKEGSVIENVLKTIKYDDGKEMFDIVVTDSDSAEKLLQDEKVTAVIHPKDNADVAMDIKKNGTKQSMVASVLAEYRQVLKTGAMQSDLTFATPKGIAGENKDPYISYFYNLIAMISMMGIISAATVLSTSNPDESYVGMRELASPINKPLYELMKLMSTITFQGIAVLIALIYYIEILGVSFGIERRYIYLTSFLALLLGQAIGFALGHIYCLKENVKVSVAMVLTLGGGFLSGLYVGDIRPLLDMYCPIINRINPSSIICDAFYALNMYGAGSRYYRSINSMIIGIAVCIVFGLVKGRRKSYASL